MRGPRRGAAAAVDIREKVRRCVEHLADNLTRFRHGQPLRDVIAR